METPLIKFNLKDRGRRHTGKERNFNIRAICDCINSQECQERVKNRDMFGYYGHLPRKLFGMDPVEGGVVQGRFQQVEAAIVTTHLRACDDGTIEHKAEFLDTAAGQLAARLYVGKKGGFSSAIDEIRPRFFGFDYVLAPNYTGNRGYEMTFDDISSMTFDDVVVANYTEQVSGMLALYDSAISSNEALAASLEHLRAENEQLLSMLAKAKPGAEFTLDGATGLSVTIDVLERMQRDAAIFRNAALPRFQEPQKTDPEHDEAYRRTRSAFSFGG